MHSDATTIRALLIKIKTPFDLRKKKKRKHTITHIFIYSFLYYTDKTHVIQHLQKREREETSSVYARYDITLFDAYSHIHTHTHIYERRH